MITLVPAVSTVDPNTFLRDIEFDASIAVVSLVDATVIVITNILLITFSEEYFQEVSPRVLQLVADELDFTLVVNEIDTVTAIFNESLPDVVITDTTDN